MKEKVLAVTEQVKSVKSHVERAEYEKVSHMGVFNCEPSEPVHVLSLLCRELAFLK